MRKLKRTFISALILANLTGYGSAMASDNVKVSDITVDIPTSQLEIESADSPPTFGTPSFALGLSSWSPGSFSLPSRITTQNSLSGSSPSFYVNYLLPLAKHKEWSLKFGGSWQSMSRVGVQPEEGYSNSYTQNVQFFSARVGTEFAPHALSGQYFTPYLSASLLPSFAVAPTSPFDEGSVYWGIPVEFAVGSRFKFKAIGVNWNDAELDLSAVGTVGSVDHSSVSGVGFNGGVRVSL